MILAFRKTNDHKNQILMTRDILVYLKLAFYIFGHCDVISQGNDTKFAHNIDLDICFPKKFG